MFEKGKDMNNFVDEYMNIIYAALDNVVITNHNGEKMQLQQALDQWADRAKNIRDEKKGLIFFCGNGASATMAEHMSHDWFQNAEINTTTCSETAHITAVGNDYSFDEIFSYRIGRIVSDRDMLVTISSSGNSPNIVKALETGRRRGAYLITLSGKEPDNKSRELGDLNFYVPLPTYGLTESAHTVLLHAALDNFLEKYMGGMH